MNQKKILFVDDDISIRQLHKQILENEGYHVEIARNGHEAIQVLAEKNVDMVITDILMPDIDGFELIMEIRRNHPQLKVMAISGGGRLSSDEYLTLANQLGVLYTLEKPFTKNQFVETVKQILYDE